MNIVLYGNGSSGNHGCEAIVRGTVALMGKSNRYIIHSANVEEDQKSHLNDISSLIPAKCPYKRGFRFFFAYLKLKLTGNYEDLDGLYYLPAIKKAKKHIDIALSVGGDNYCYEGVGIYAFLNRSYKKNKMKTVLWGCSIEPNVVAQKKIKKDLCNYDLIIARESITYEAIKQIQENTLLAPDPAFFMEYKKCNLSNQLNSDNIIGINVSPHILKCETIPGIAYQNFKQLIQYILSETNATIALIPHVVWESNDDRTVLRKLYDDFDHNSRLVLVADHTAPELKYIISKCNFFVGARTHATIAAYSSCVPTLVVGYSVKARGIARDLFGTEEGYVLPVQEMTNPDQLTKAFCCLYQQREQISAHLHQIMPSYLAPAQRAVSAIKDLK